MSITPGNMLTRMCLALALPLLLGCASTPRQSDLPIHQEIVFKAPPERVYRAIMDPHQFAEVTGRSVAGISPDQGGEFSCFDGIIIGRNIELVPNRRIVQAWRERTWPPGVYSIARFDLKPEAGGTRLVFDHTGFPEGAGEHLRIGWYENYWTPLEKYLARSTPASN